MNGKTALGSTVRNLNYSLAEVILNSRGDLSTAEQSGVTPPDLLRKLVVHAKEHRPNPALMQEYIWPMVRLFEEYGWRLDLPESP